MPSWFSSFSWRMPSVPLMLIFMYFCNFFLTGLNYWWVVSFERRLFGDTLVDAHLTFVILGSVIFIFIGSPFIFWPYRYGQQMTAKSRRNCIFFGVASAWLTHDFPLWLIEFWIAWQYGFLFELQGICLMVLSISTAVGAFTVWLGYAWKMAKACQRYYGTAAGPDVLGGLTGASGFGAAGFGPGAGMGLGGIGGGGAGAYGFGGGTGAGGGGYDTPHPALPIASQDMMSASRAYGMPPRI